MQVHEKDVYNEANLKENYKDYKTPFDASDYAVCYDYVIKRYISDCYNQKFNPMYLSNSTTGNPHFSASFRTEVLNIGRLSCQ